MITCTNKPCPLRYMCERANDTQTGEFFEYTQLKGHDKVGNIRYTYGCREFEKKKEMTQEKKEIPKKMYDKIVDNIFDQVDEVYGKLEPTSLEKDVD